MHIRSLRLRADELFVACDGEGTDYICRLGNRGALYYGSQTTNQRPQSNISRSIAEIVEARPSLGEPSVDCSVFIAFAKGDRLDYAVQKSVELGAHDIVLFPSERCVSFPEDTSKKTVRLQRIAFETAKQCGRGRVPGVSAVGSFESAIRKASAGDSQPAAHDSQLCDDERPEAASGLSLFFYEQEETMHLDQALERYFQSNSQSTVCNSQPEDDAADRGLRRASGSVAIVTGPEGGFEPREAEIARSAGLSTVSLGPRILRCETAPVAALAAIMFFTGNL